MLYAPQKGWKANNHEEIAKTLAALEKVQADFNKKSSRKASLADIIVIGGMRTLGANTDGSANGVFTKKPGTLNNDFFVNLLDMSTKWQKSKTEGLYEGVDRKTGQAKWTATPVDLLFGSHSELRAVSEFYAANDNKDRFYKDFSSAWNKVMMLDRFEVKK